MTLREMVREYRESQGLSQRRFAEKCGLSNGYISMLERNENPKTGLPLTPSLPALKKIASGMGMTLTDLFTVADDIPIDLLVDDMSESASALGSESGRDSLDTELASLILGLSPEKKKEAVRYIQYLADRAEN